MARTSIELVEMDQLASAEFQPTALSPESHNGMSESAGGQNSATSQAHTSVVPPAGQAYVVEGQQQNLEAPQEEGPGAGPVGLTNGTGHQDVTLGKEEEWISTWLRYPIIAPAILGTVGLMATIIALAHKSIHQHGITSTNPDLEVEKSFLIFQFGLGVLWTFIPSFVFQLYALTLAKIAKEASIRQPYVELRRPLENEGVSAQKSILLDYQSYWLPHAPIKALEYHHYMLAYSFFIVILLNIFLAPLTAHLFFAAPLSSDHPIEVTRSASFEYLSGETPYSMAPVLGTVSSTLTYGGQPIPWTTLERSFVPVEIPHKLVHANDITNLTLPVNAYAAQVKCKALGSSEFVMGQDNEGKWKFSFRDRGCSAKDQFFAPAINQFLVDFVHTYDYPDCSYDAGYSRVIVIGAQRESADSNNLTNRTAISCIPTYSEITGSLTVSIDPSKPDHPTIHDLSVTDQHTYSPPPGFAYVFESQLIAPDFIDFRNVLSANAYGEVIYNQIQKLNPNAYLSEETLLNATISTFVAAFAVTAKTYLIKSTAPVSVQATYSSESMRVFVDLGVAWTVIILLALGLIMLSWITCYTIKHASILYEEPRAMIAPIVMTRKSELLARIEDYDPASYRGRVGTAFIKDEVARVKDNGWVFENWEKPREACLTTRPRALSFGYFKRGT